MNRQQPSVIAWGVGFLNLLSTRFPLDNVNTGSEPRAGYESAQAPSGVEDAWVTGEDEILEGELRWVPIRDTTDVLLAYEPGDSLALATMTRASTASYTQETAPVPLPLTWDGATGLKAFLSYAAVGRQLVRFYPDLASYYAGVGMVECYVIEPVRAMADSIEPDGSRRVRLKLRSAVAFDGY